LEIIIITAVVFLPLFLFGVIFVSIVWTHRPDFSVMDIIREAVKEIKNSRAGKDRQKGKTV
jgi:regulatory protein YycH of two-component signal transduction system YycFG